MEKNFTMWVTSFKTHCLVFFVCLFWKVGCVSTGVVTVFVFFPSVLPVIRTVLILFLQLTCASLKRINQYSLLIPHTAASYLKPCPCYFFLLYPFFQELTQNCDAPTGQMFSLLLFRSIFTSEFFSLLSFTLGRQLFWWNMNENTTLHVISSIPALTTFSVFKLCPSQFLFNKPLFKELLPLSLLFSDLTSAPSSGVREGPATPQTGAAGKWPQTTHQANDRAHCTPGSGEQAHAEVGWEKYIFPLNWKCSWQSYNSSCFLWTTSQCKFSVAFQNGEHPIASL